MNGLVLIDKPQGLTSHDVVNRWRRLAQTKRVGHLGTLDPMATGLLVIVSGNTTRLARFFERHEKTYEAEIRFGFISDTYDAEGDVQATGVPPPPFERIAEGLNRFRGEFLQTPPPVSAKKIRGVPAYKLARRNQPIDLSPIPVAISKLDLHSLVGDTAQLTVTCSAGTYIRGLAHDLGQQLGCGAMLTSLRRTASGSFHVSAARTLDQLEQLAQANTLASAVIPPIQILPEFPAAYMDEAAESQIRLGREFRTSPFVIEPGTPIVKALSHSGELIAIGQLKFPNVYHPMMVL